MFALAVMLSGSALTSARADVVVQIDKSSQYFKPARPWRRPENLHTTHSCFPENASRESIASAGFFNHPITVSIIGKISCETGKFARSLCNFSVRHASVAWRRRFCFPLVLTAPIGGCRAMRVAPISGNFAFQTGSWDPTSSPDDAAADGLTPASVTNFSDTYRRT
jgi:hypothetical protein